MNIQHLSIIFKIMRTYAFKKNLRDLYFGDDNHLIINVFY